MLISKGLRSYATGSEIFAKGGFRHDGSMCTPARYDAQAPLYPSEGLASFYANAHKRSMANRLAHLRKKAGISQEALGKALNSGRSTITKLERSEIPLTDRWLDRLALVLNCVPADILGDYVPIVGKIGAGGSVIFEDMGNSETTRRPPDTIGELIGLEVVGESMLPKFDPGDIVYISRINEGVDVADIGANCACRLRTGETYLKQLIKGSKAGLFTLRSYNAADIEDVELEWATPIRASIPRHARRYS